MLLIIHRSERIARPLTDMLRYMGVIAYHVRPEAALGEISTRYRGVLVLEPEALPDPEDFLVGLRACGADIPFFALTDSEERAPYMRRFLGVFDRETTASEMMDRITAICSALGTMPPGLYTFSGIDACAACRECLYLGRPMGLTSTEARILRFLCRTYPDPVSPAVIARYVFSPAKQPQLSDIRTHVSAINRKFRALTDGKELIGSSGRDGYRMLSAADREAALAPV